MSDAATVRSEASGPKRRMGIVGYVKRTVATVIVAAVLAGAGFVALSLVRGTWMVTPVLSGSMRPGFPVGGVVVSERVPLKDIALRDVIVFQNPIKRTEEMIHRIVKLTRLPNGLIKIRTQGDANPVPDPWTIVVHTREVYKIRWSLPLLGYVAVAYQDHRGILLVVAGALLVFIAAGIWFEAASKKRARAATTDPDPAPPGAGSAPPFVQRFVDETGGSEDAVPGAPVAATNGRATAEKGVP
jgi:signal peptidase